MEILEVKKFFQGIIYKYYAVYYTYIIFAEINDLFANIANEKFNQFFMLEKNIKIIMKINILVYYAK